MKRRSITFTLAAVALMGLLAMTALAATTGTINGTVTVQPGGAFYMQCGSVNNSITSNGASGFKLCAAQKINGNVMLQPVHAGLRDAKLRGPFIQFAYVDQTGVRRDFQGRVNATRMEGTFRDDKGSEGKWTAAKK